MYLGYLIDIYFLNKGAVIIGEVGFADKRHLIQRAMLVLLEQRPLDQGPFICKPNLQIINAPLSRKYMSTMSNLLVFIYSVPSLQDPKRRPHIFAKAKFIRQTLVR